MSEHSYCVHVQCSVQHSSTHRGQTIQVQENTHTHIMSTKLSNLIDVRFFISIRNEGKCRSKNLQKNGSTKIYNEKVIKFPRKHLLLQ